MKDGKFRRSHVFENAHAILFLEKRKSRMRGLLGLTPASFGKLKNQILEFLVLWEAVLAVHRPALCRLERNFAFLAAV